MGKLIIDPAFQAQLAGLKEPTVLTDSSGMPLGEFLPEEQFPQFGPEVYRLAEAQCPYSTEELERMRQATGGQSLAEFWRTIGAK